MASTAPPFEDVATQDFTTKAEDGHELLLRWFYKKDLPTQPGSAFVYAHGGGMIACSLNVYDKVIKANVSASGVPLLAVEYRLAPEVRAPVPMTDVYAGLQWLHAHAAELGVDPARIGIAGDSAGGGIAASLAHYVKKNGGPAIQKQILVYPMLDDRTIDEDPLLGDYLIWNEVDNETGWTALLGDRRGTDDVAVTEAPGRMTVEDAKDLPPAYIDIGELDLFRDEDIAYAQKLGRAGVSCELYVLPGLPHGFEALAPTSAAVQTAIAGRVRAYRSI